MKMICDYSESRVLLNNKMNLNIFKTTAYIYGFFLKMNVRIS